MRMASPSNTAHDRSATLACRRAIWSKRWCPVASIEACGSAAWWSKPVAGLISSFAARRPVCTRSIAHGYGRRMAICTPCLRVQAPPFPPPAEAGGLHGGFVRNADMVESSHTTPITIRDIEDMEARGVIREIVDGQWVEASEEKMAGELHGAIATNLIIALGSYVKAHQ